MAKKGSREARFSSLKRFFDIKNAGLLDEASAQANVAFTGDFVYESELPKFAEQFPEVQIEDFKTFLVLCNAIKVAGKAKKAEGEATVRQTKLDTVEKAQQLGVTEENMSLYISLVQQVMALRTQIKAIVPLGDVSFSIPLRKKAGESDGEATAESAE